MIYSMTGFAREECQYDWGNIAWELRSINHRFLETNIYLPEIFRRFEGTFRTQIKSKLGRGKIDLSLTYRPATTLTANISLNTGLIKELQQVYSEIKNVIPELQPIDALAMLKWPGVTQISEIDLKGVEPQISLLLDETLEQLVQARRREGESLQRYVLERLTKAQQEVNAIVENLPQVNQQLKQRFMEKLADLELKIDASRIEQEVVFLLQRSDIAEELARLQIHLNEIARVINTGGNVGRRLDFLLQECLRETNTLGAKAMDVNTSANVVELKVLIEQIREQIQNIE